MNAQALAAVAREEARLGEAAVEPLLELADRDGVPSYLESSNVRNVSFYERLGFRVLDELRMPGGGPSMRPMWRDPA